ncbi:hypothetical protein BRADI_1g37626v3 [Brachypodium distachyon]|uniref:Protein kinase domain-containing protein n=1 Tax=Brachypodium distachyon TaxID=15368 RepID=A0A0Q3H646_BRADI|nr:hypothetical protein BRADI_1g37626v3 [Brachypodium distachyon]
MDGESSRLDNQESILHDQTPSPDKLPLQYLKEITNSFSDERVLGEGSFGVVYKGVLQNGEMVAVKKLMALMPGFQKQFENEVYHLMRLNHPNIVRCVGYCYETQNFCLEYKGKYVFAETAERLLCLEYMAKGSLDNYLADESCGLDWHTRYNIISGICYGLHYLHEDWQTNTPIIHLDLKPANILLDDNMVPKIADFGLSRLFGEQQTRACTTTRDGTFGYMAPEYIHRGIITTKSDIFSLGVIIIEIITGQKNYPFGNGTSYDFVELVLTNWRNRLEATSCSSLETDCQQIRSCLELGLRCLESDPIKRPATKEIIEKLTRWGGTNVDGGSDERSLTLWIPSDPSEFLCINPRMLQFFLGLNKWSRCLVQLTNKTEEHVAFYFGVQRATTNYCIEPASAFLCPRSTFTVCVTMEEQSELPSHLQCNDEFLVQTIVVRANTLTSEHTTVDSFNMSINVVHKANLTVAYVPPAQPPPLLHVGLDEKKTLDPRRFEGFSDQENVDILIRCICQDLGFSDDRPIAACIVYKCLLHWKSFQAGTTNVFDRIIASMFSAIKAQGNERLAYWLSNSYSLLMLMQGTMKTAGAGRFTPRRSLTAIIRMRNREFGGSHLIGGKGGMQQIEAKRPALLFKGHLTGFFEKVYGMIIDNLTKEISPLLGCCIEAPTITSQALFDHWQRIVNILTDCLLILKSNYVSSFLISKVFTRLFSFIDVQLFNSLLLSESCSFRDGEYVKAGLAKLEQWCTYETEEYAGSSWEELKHIRKAAIFLTMREKQKKTLKEITCHVCPVLSIPQLYRFCTIYQDGKYGNHNVSPLADVLSSMESLMMEDENNTEKYSLLLYDKLESNPFSVEDIPNSVAEFELIDADMPPLIRENPCFDFLYRRTD